MAYNGLTNAGAAYLAARQANNLPVEFLKAKVGNGIVPDGTDPAELTDIISEKMEIEISDIQQVERALKMAVQVSNESLTTGFYLTEIAIYVNDNGTAVLYWYIGKDNGTYVPDSTKPMKYKNILNIEVSSAPITTVNYTGKDLWVDEEKLNIELDKKVDKDVYTEMIETLNNGKLDKYTLTKEDFNNYITNGIYYLIGDNAVPNAPTNNRGILLVAELGTVITQIFFPYFSAGEYYQRNFIISSGTWSEWKNPIIKSNSVTSDSTSDVATSLAVKTAYDTALKKAGKFVYDKTSSYPNVNDLREVGIYYMNNDVLCPGSPHQNRAMMIVSDSTYPMQIWYPYFSQGVYYTRYWTGSSWSSWERSSSLEGSRNKYIIKDMTISFTSGAAQNFYFNNAFPNECLGVYIGDISNSGSNLEAVQLYNTTTTGFTGMAVSVPEISPVAVTVKIMALGY